MAGYGYTYRSGYTTSYNGAAPGTDGRSKTSYASDRVCQPVIVDADGRRKPIISYTPNGNTEYYVTKTEVVEHVPLVAGYKQSTPVRVEVVTDYGDLEGKRNRPSSPEKWRKSSSPVRYHHSEEKWNRPSSPEKWSKSSSPVRYHHADEKWNRPSSPVRYHAEEKWNRSSSPVHERPQQVEDFITKVQTQASRPNKFSPLNATYWRQTPNPNSYHVNTGYGDQGDLSNKEWQKPNGNTIRNEYMEPTMTTGGAWSKPSHGGWSTPQGVNKLGQPTSDINTAMEYLKEAAKPFSGITPPPSRHTVPVSTGPKRDIYSESIESREAERRYGGLNFTSRDNYTRNY